MSAETGIRVLNDYAIAKGLSDSEWVKTHVPRFDRIRPRYLAYQSFLDAVLREFSRMAAPLAIVQARAKGVPSFAEKILRKRQDYMDPANPLPPDPLLRLTDLCGGRVIVQTASQLKDICRLIERAFDIDWPNSDDASKRLKTTEFGYRTVNYIVLPNAEKLKAAGIAIPVPPEVLGSTRRESPEPTRLKAEIQIRTLLEHAYADIGHDLAYKTEVKVPARLLRSFAAVAAVLETADVEFGRLVREFDSFKTHYGAFHSAKQVRDEIARLRVVLSCDKENLSLVARIADLALALGAHDEAIEVLDPYRSRRHQGVAEALGTALTERYWSEPNGPEFIEGLTLLRSACSYPERKAEVLGTLAECLVHADEEAQAEARFREALAVDSAEPRSLCGYLQFEVAHQRGDAVIRLAAPMIRNAMARCRTQIAGGVNLPTAWSCLAVFHLMVNESFEALNALAHVIALCQCDPGAAGDAPRLPCAAGRALMRLRDSMRRLKSVEKDLDGYASFERTLLTGLAVKLADPKARKSLEDLASWRAERRAAHIARDERIVVLSGGCADSFQTTIDNRRHFFLEACKGLSFTLLSGGTIVGISGVAGEVAAQSRGKIRAIGYLPKPILLGIRQTGQKSTYDLLVPSSGNDFTPLEPLQGWIDLLAAGVDPKRVKLVSYGGHRISTAELTLALALGARVGLVVDPELPKDRQFEDVGWIDHPGLIRLPPDPMTLRAFLVVDELPLDEAQQKRLERAARMAHEAYRASATPRDPSLASWESLDPNLKLSNYHQVAYWEKMLAEFGLSVRAMTEADDAHPPLDMGKAVGDDGIKKLAEMEHGRWNVERLSRGWRYAKAKDISKKLSPYLVPWEQVPEGIQKYDLDAIQRMPENLRQVGLEVVRT